LDRQRLAALDVASWGQDETELELSRSQIDVRLRLARLGPLQWQIRGADRVLVQRQSHASIESMIIQHVRVRYAQAMAISEEELDVSLAMPLPANLVGEFGQMVDELVPEIPEPPKCGRIVLRVRAHQQGSLARVYSIHVDVRQFADVPIISNPLRRGQPVTEDDIQRERRPIVHPEQLVTPADLQDAVALVSLMPGQPLLRRHLRYPVEQDPFDVTTRSELRVVARRGALTVVMSDGRAMESGRIGETIRVRNPRSGQILVGKIVAPGEVQVSF
jgi:flagella basal body P-ring formation protein FlgA